MSARRDFLKRSLILTASGLFLGQRDSLASPNFFQSSDDKQSKLKPPPDLFDAQALDMDFWLKPRTIDWMRPASGERLKLLYWKDGEIVGSAYEQCCEILRDIHADKTARIDPKLIETLWATQAFINQLGMTKPLELLSGYRTPESNQRLREEGIPAARKSLHMDGKAADFRIANLHEEVLGELVQSFRQGGVGFYFRASKQGGWIHADTGLKRSWQG